MDEFNMSYLSGFVKVNQVTVSTIWGQTQGCIHKEQGGVDKWTQVRHIREEQVMTEKGGEVLRAGN